MKRPKFYMYHSWAIDKLGMCTPEMAVFTIINSYEDGNKTCFMSMSEFAKITGCSRMTISRAINKLENEYKVIRRYSSQLEYRNSNTYEIVQETVCEWVREYEDKRQKNIEDPVKTNNKESKKKEERSDFEEILGYSGGIQWQ